MKSYNGFTPRERMKAYNWLMAEYAAGRRIRPTQCDVCLTTEGLIQPHSEDYSAPFGDHTGRYGLCYRCHMMIHCRFAAPMAFRAYADSLAAGRRYTPIPSQQWGTFSRDHMGQTRIVASIDVGQVLPGFDRLLIEGHAAMSRRNLPAGEPPRTIGQLTLTLKATNFVERGVVREECRLLLLRVFDLGLDEATAAFEPLAFVLRADRGLFVLTPVAILAEHFGERVDDPLIEFRVLLAPLAEPLTGLGMQRRRDAQIVAGQVLSIVQRTPLHLVLAEVFENVVLAPVINRLDQA